MLLRPVPPQNPTPTEEITDAEVRAALVAPTRRWRFRYDVIQPNGAIRGQVEINGASIANNDLADGAKRTGQFTIMPNSLGINYFKDRLRVYALLQIPPGDRWHQFPLGTFHMTTDTGKRGRTGAPTQVAGFDSLLVLAEDRVAGRYHVAGGTNYRAAINTLLTSAGFATKAVAATTLTVPGKGEEWPPGTSKLEIINDLLDAIGYRSLVMDPMGIPTSQDWQSPKQAAPVWTYDVGPESVIQPGLISTIDLHSIPNRWVAWVSEPDRPLLVARKTNNDPNSLTSTVSRGRTITEVLNAPNKLPKKGKKETRKHHRHATQQVLEAYVDRVAENASQTYEVLEFTTGLMPFHQSGDVILADWGEGQTRWREVEWSMTLTPGGEMQHKARRVVEL